MVSAFGESILDGEILNSSNALIDAETNSFTKLLELSSIDPTCELRYANLSRVNFSGVDFKGYDLTGADLRCAYGVDVKNLEDAVTTDADLTESLFDFSRRRSRLFNLNPELKSEAETLLKRDWRGQHTWIEPAVKRVKDGDTGLKYVAQTLLEESNDLTVQKTLLYFMEDFFQTSAEWTSYIRHMIATKPENHPIFEHAATLYTFNYMLGEEAKDVLLALLPHSSFEVKRHALRGLSQLSGEGYLSVGERNRVKRYTEGPALAAYRRELLLRNVTRLNHNNRAESLSTRLEKLESVRDFIDPLDAKTSETLAATNWYYLVNDTPLDIDPETLIEQRKNARKLLTELWNESNIRFRPPEEHWLYDFYRQLSKRSRSGKPRSRSKRALEWTPIPAKQRRRTKRVEPTPELDRMRMIKAELFKETDFRSAE